MSLKVAYLEFFHITVDKNATVANYLDISTGHIILVTYVHWTSSELRIGALGFVFRFFV
jgi:hypothetical protein